MPSTNSTAALAPWADKLIALLSDGFVVKPQEISFPTPSSGHSTPPHKTQTQNGFQANPLDPPNTNSATVENITRYGHRATLSNDSSSSKDTTASASSTRTSISESAKPQPTNTNLSNLHHELKLPPWEKPKLLEIEILLDDLRSEVPYMENRLSLSKYFPNEPHPSKYSLFLSRLEYESLNDFPIPDPYRWLPRDQWLLHNIKLKVGDSTLPPITTVPLGRLFYDDDLTYWIIVLDRLGNLFALRSQEIDWFDLEIPDGDDGDIQYIECNIADVPAFGESLQAAYLGPFEKLKVDDSTTTSSSLIPLDKVHFWESAELTNKMVSKPILLCRDLDSILQDTASDMSIV